MLTTTKRQHEGCWFHRSTPLHGGCCQRRSGSSRHRAIGRGNITGRRTRSHIPRACLDLKIGAEAPKAISFTAHSLSPGAERPDPAGISRRSRTPDQVRAGGGGCIQVIDFKQ
jgi:hypothetical protein